MFKRSVKMPKLIDDVIDQIMMDVKNEDLTAIEEFLLIALHYVPEKYLIEFLSEEKQNA
jgi:hypothetical protein